MDFQLLCGITEHLEVLSVRLISGKARWVIPPAFNSRRFQVWLWCFCQKLKPDHCQPATWYQFVNYVGTSRLNFPVCHLPSKWPWVDEPLSLRFHVCKMGAYDSTHLTDFYEAQTRKCMTCAPSVCFMIKHSTNARYRISWNSNSIIFHIFMCMKSIRAFNVVVVSFVFQSC